MPSLVALTDDENFWRVISNFFKKHQNKMRGNAQNNLSPYKQKAEIQRALEVKKKLEKRPPQHPHQPKAVRKGLTSHKTIHRYNPMTGKWAVKIFK